MGVNFELKKSMLRAIIIFIYLNDFEIIINLKKCRTTPNQLPSYTRSGNSNERN